MNVFFQKSEKSFAFKDPHYATQQYMWLRDNSCFMRVGAAKISWICQGAYIVQIPILNKDAFAKIALEI